MLFCSTRIQQNVNYNCILDLVGVQTNVRYRTKLVEANGDRQRVENPFSDRESAIGKIGNGPISRVDSRLRYGIRSHLIRDCKSVNRKSVDETAGGDDSRPLENSTGGSSSNLAHWGKLDHYIIQDTRTKINIAGYAGYASSLSSSIF